MSGGAAPLQLGLLGVGIGHSRSPALHAAGMRALARVGSYERYESPDIAHVHVQLDRLRRGELTGLNVTTPWKQTAAAACDQLFTAVVAPGSAAITLRPLQGEPRRPVNTLFMRDGALCGTSTDGPGLGLALAGAHISLDGAAIGLLGCGGAGASVAHWLVDQGADLRWLSNRSPAPAAALAAELAARGHSATVLPWRELGPMAAATLVFHASKVGHGCVGADAEAAAAQLAHAPWRAWAQGATLVDLVYSDGATAAQRCARAAGAPPERIFSGSGQAMLACQAALSLAIWAGQRPPVAAMLAALRG